MAPSASALPSYPPGISQEAKEAIAGGPAAMHAYLNERGLSGETWNGRRYQPASGALRILSPNREGMAQTGQDMSGGDKSTRAVMAEWQRQHPQGSKA